MQRYFLTTESTYETLRTSLDILLGYPTSTAASIFQTALQAPRDNLRRVILALDTDIPNYATIDAQLDPLLANLSVKEVTESEYLTLLSTPVQIPTASSTVLGGIKVGSGLAITAGVLRTTGGGGGGGGDVTSVAGRTGDVVLTTADISGYTAPVVTSVAGRTGAVTLTTSDITNYSAYVLPNATTTTLGGVIVGAGLGVSSGTITANVTSVAGRTGAVTLTTTDISGYTAPTVTSVAGKTGAVTLASDNLTDYVHPFLLAGM
jgi:hypothetical protein